MVFGKHVAERLPHALQIGAGAMDHHDRRAGGVVRPDIHDMERRAGDLDHPPLRGIGALQGKDARLRGHRQDNQRRHDNECYHLKCPDEPGHR